jgi:N-acetylmuramoyl-L-alanine amidase
MRKIERIVVHCTAGNKYQKAAALVQYFLTSVSRGGRGWSAPGYHYVVEYDGTVVNTYDEALVANGAKGFNATAIHVAYTGGVANGKPCDTRSDAQKTALRRIIAVLSKRYPNAKVMGHRDLSPDRNGDGVIQPNEWIKACPSFDVKTEL